jgi:hypothetical protein|tara:strand:- start:542 stop:1384 length:843 start_codon:yes stop_codon:yes gene_type:complete
MKSIVSLGKVATKIAMVFKNYPQYTVYKINKEANKKSKFTLPLPSYENPEDYDALELELGTFFQRLSKDVLFIVCGSSVESAFSLKVLKALREQEAIVTILYIVPERAFLNEVERLNERVVYHVLQEYTRSGLFERLFLVDNQLLSDCLGPGELNLINYHDKTNELLANTIHMINVFNHTKPIISDVSSLQDTSRLGTFGVTALGEEERSFFLLDKPTEKDYYLAMNKTDVTSPGTMERVKTHMGLHSADQKINYSVYTTEYDESYIYYMIYSSKIQEIA